MTGLTAVTQSVTAFTTPDLATFTSQAVCCLKQQRALEHH